MGIRLDFAIEGHTNHILSTARRVRTVWSIKPCFWEASGEGLDVHHLELPGSGLDKNKARAPLKVQSEVPRDRHELTQVSVEPSANYGHPVSSINLDAEVLTQRHVVSFCTSS